MAVSGTSAGKAAAEEEEEVMGMGGDGFSIPVRLVLLFIKEN